MRDDGAAIDGKGTGNGAKPEKGRAEAAAQSAALARRALRGDGQAFSELVHLHRRVALSVAYGVVGETNQAADVVQEAFLKAFQVLRQLKEPDRFLSWFLTIVRTTATDAVRRRVRWGVREIPVAGGEFPQVGGDTNSGVAGGGIGSGIHAEVGPEERLLQQEEATEIRAALGSLSPDYREIILLKHGEGLSYKEIATLLAISVRAVESRLFRARQRLGELLGIREREFTDLGTEGSGT
ncbi:MAG: RNA polymerase sigma factor [Planctomycetota bacterium]